MNDLLTGFEGWVTHVVYSFGYAGVAFLIALQNLFPPIPSALILPLAGFLVGQGRFSFLPLLLAATAGSVASALILYALGRRLGEERLRRFTGRFGRFVFVDESDLDRVSGWFERRGGAAVLFGRLVPGVGTLVSLPAGFWRMPILRFAIYTALGTSLWNGAFIGLGWALGARWRLVQQYASIIQYPVLAAAAVVAAWLLWRRWGAPRR